MASAEIPGMFRPINLNEIPYEPPARRDGMLEEFLEMDIQEKWLVRPEEGFPVSVIRYGPGVSVPRHSHSAGELVYIISGSAIWNGHELTPGMAGFVGADVAYGPEAAGPDGVEFLLMRPRFSRYQDER